MGENVFCIRSEKIFLRVRMRFVQCRDALMQILVRQDRDKNSSVDTAGALVASYKRRTVELCFLFLFLKKVTNRACKWEENYGGTCFFFKRLTVGLFVKKTINRACECGETYGRTCFIFLLLFSWPTLDLKKKKKFCFSCIVFGEYQASSASHSSFCSSPSWPWQKASEQNITKFLTHRCIFIYWDTLAWMGLWLKVSFSVGYYWFEWGVFLFLE